MGRQKKAPSGGAPGLPPLPSAAAAGLQELTARLSAGLEEGLDLETLREMAAAGSGDLAWDLHLLAAMSSLAHPAIPGLLIALFAASGDKPRRKALKRALHLLKTRGVPVADNLLPREEAAPLRDQGRAPALAHLSQVLGNGERYVILEGPREVLGGNVLVSRVSDREGLLECHLLNLKSRQRQEFWDHFHSQGLAEWATPPSAYAVRLLEEADQLQPEAPGSSSYRSLKPRILKEWGPPEAAPELDELLPPLNPGEQSRLLDQSKDLVRHPLFLPWLPGLDELTPWLNKLREVQESPLVLSEPQRQARMEGVVEEAVGALFPLETRDLVRRRLLAMAYFLKLRSQEEEARMAQAAAQDLAAGSRGSLAGENPFLQTLVWEALKLARGFLEQTQKEGESPSPILAPSTDPLLIRR